MAVSAMVVLTLLLCLFASCSSDEDEVARTSKYANKTLMLFISPKGLNTDGYASIYTEALLDLEQKHGFHVEVYVPNSIEHAKELLSDLLMYDYPDRETEDILLMIGDNSYKNILLELADSIKTLPDDFMDNVVLFETTGEELPCYSFRVEKYGAMYIAGNIATNFSDSASVMMAYNDSTLLSAYKGFEEGFDASGFGFNVQQTFIDSDAAGYNRPIDAERMAQSFYEQGYHFIMPLAGMSNEGVYAASRNLEECYTAGMDYDVEAKSDELAFNVLVHIDSLVCEYALAWLHDDLNKIPRFRALGLESGYIEVVPTPFYWESCGEWIRELMPVAIKREERYLVPWREVE
ncbi:MAG: BMP family ABC transporter substrate-binding protein [Prevotellaceae bacterium]|nr:BMP family ABC transporter substrate-binding protein [Candidatus Minthosoma caballi]